MGCVRSGSGEEGCAAAGLLRGWLGCGCGCEVVCMRWCV